MCHNPARADYPRAQVTGQNITAAEQAESHKRCKITRLQNKVAIVTGAGTRSQNVTGVGVATARLFASHGAKVLIVDMDESAARSTENTIIESGGEASVFLADVADESSCKSLVETAVERYGKLDILMNSVGIGGPGMATEVTQDSWNRVLDVDLKSMVFISKYV